MPKLYFHAGVFDNAPAGVEVLGALTATGKEMSCIGRHLRPGEESDRHVFTNNENVFNGLRLAVGNGELNHEDVVLIHHYASGGGEAILIDRKGFPQKWPEGFFDQLENDMMQMIEIKHG